MCPPPHRVVCAVSCEGARGGQSRGPGDRAPLCRPLPQRVLPLGEEKVSDLGLKDGAHSQVVSQQHPQGSILLISVFHLWWEGVYYQLWDIFVIVSISLTSVKISLLNLHTPPPSHTHVDTAEDASNISQGYDHGGAHPPLTLWLLLCHLPWR